MLHLVSWIPMYQLTPKSALTSRLQLLVLRQSGLANGRLNPAALRSPHGFVAPQKMHECAKQRWVQHHRPPSGLRVMPTSRAVNRQRSARVFALSPHPHPEYRVHRGIEPESWPSMQQLLEPHWLRIFRPFDPSLSVTQSIIDTDQPESLPIVFQSKSPASVHQRHRCPWLFARQNA